MILRGKGLDELIAFQKKYSGDYSGFSYPIIMRQVEDILGFSQFSHEK